MKTCPVCKSLCFDDMPVCYGCMHDFGRDALCVDRGSKPLSSDASVDVVRAEENDVATADDWRDAESTGAMGEEGQSAAPRPAVGLRIPMITSVASGADPCASGSGAHLPEHPGSMQEPMSPLFTMEVPAGCRAVFRLERI